MAAKVRIRVPEEPDELVLSLDPPKHVTVLEQNVTHEELSLPPMVHLRVLWVPHERRAEIERGYVIHQSAKTVLFLVALRVGAQLSWVEWTEALKQRLVNEGGYVLPGINVPARIQASIHAFFHPAPKATNGAHALPFPKPSSECIRQRTRLDWSLSLEPRETLPRDCLRVYPDGTAYPDATFPGAMPGTRVFDDDQYQMFWQTSSWLLAMMDDRFPLTEAHWHAAAAAFPMLASHFTLSLESAGGSATRITSASFVSIAHAWVYLRFTNEVVDENSDGELDLLHFQPRAKSGAQEIDRFCTLAVQQSYGRLLNPFHETESEAYNRWIERAEIVLDLSATRDPPTLWVVRAEKFRGSGVLRYAFFAMPWTCVDVESADGAPWGARSLSEFRGWYMVEECATHFASGFPEWVPKSDPGGSGLTLAMLMSCARETVMPEVVALYGALVANTVRAVCWMDAELLADMSDAQFEALGDATVGVVDGAFLMVRDESSVWMVTTGKEAAMNARWTMMQNRLGRGRLVTLSLEESDRTPLTIVLVMVQWALRRPEPWVLPRTTSSRAAARRWIAYDLLRGSVDRAWWTKWFDGN